MAWPQRQRRCHHGWFWEAEDAALPEGSGAAGTRICSVHAHNYIVGVAFRGSGKVVKLFCAAIFDLLDGQVSFYLHYHPLPLPFESVWWWYWYELVDPWTMAHALFVLHWRSVKIHCWWHLYPSTNYNSFQIGWEIPTKKPQKRQRGILEPDLKVAHNRLLFNDTSYLLFF